MNKIVLITSVAIITLGMVSESRAEEICKNISGLVVTCIEKLTDANGNNSCGTNCTFRVVTENGKQVLHVYKTDPTKPAIIREGAFSPSYYAGNQVKDAQGNDVPLQNIMLDDDFETIERYIFSGSGAQIFNTTGQFVFDNGERYFAGFSTLNGDVIFGNSVAQAVEGTQINGDIIISDDVTDITMWSFEHTEVSGNIIIPASVQNAGKHAFRNLSVSGKIYCAAGIEVCYNMIKSGCNNEESCLSSLKDLFDNKKFSTYPDGCAKLEANLECTKCKSDSFRLNDGECDRIRYTPAEAAAVLHDDNTNSVTITFKK